MFHCSVGSLGTRCDGSIQLWRLLPPSPVSHWLTQHSFFLYLPPSSSFFITRRVSRLHSIFLSPRPAVRLSLSILVFISRPPLAKSLLPPLLTVCPRRQVIGPGVC